MLCNNNVTRSDWFGGGGERVDYLTLMQTHVTMAVANIGLEGLIQGEYKLIRSTLDL